MYPCQVTAIPVGITHYTTFGPVAQAVVRTELYLRACPEQTAGWLGLVIYG